MHTLTTILTLDPPIPEEVDEYMREILYNDFDAVCEDGTAIDVGTSVTFINSPFMLRHAGLV
jgi:hypothetical protein